MAFVYILRCADGTLYVGHTDDVPSRERLHNDGSAAIYTAARRPVKVVYVEEHSSKVAAVQRERQVKRWSAEKKNALISGNSRALQTLSRRRR